MEITLQAASNLLTQDAGKALSGAKESSPILKTDEENRLVAIADFLFHLGIGNYRKKKHLEKLNVDEQEECSYRKKQMGTCCCVYVSESQSARVEPAVDASGDHFVLRQDVFLLSVVIE
ncbi:hypothetical protein SDJN03_15768, partial [Cucurbita argyrosperma subsp. sororia]